MVWGGGTHEAGKGGRKKKVGEKQGKIGGENAKKIGRKFGMKKIRLEWGG